VGNVAARAFLADVDAGSFTLVEVAADAFGRAVSLDAQHADAAVGLVDASVAAVAELRRARTIFTLDHADLRLLVSADVDLRPTEAELR